MNLDVFKQRLIKATIKSMSWDEEETEENNLSVLNTKLGIQPFDDDIQLRVIINDEGYLSVKAIFDSIEPSYDVYKLINHFNANTSLLCAFVGEGRNRYLVLKHENPECTDENYAVSQVLAVIDYLCGEEAEKYLEPLCVITE